MPIVRICLSSQAEFRIDMVVCNCFNIRERDLAELASEGRCCLRSVREATGLGTNCGKCIPHAREVLAAKPPMAQLVASVDLTIVATVPQIAA